MPVSDLRDTLRSGFHLKEDEIAELENSITSKTENLSARVKLLGFYWFNKKWDEATPHLIWLITNHPEIDLLAWEVSQIGDLSKDKVLFDTIRLSWEEKLKKHPTNPSVLTNAAAFFLGSNKKRTIELLEKALKVVDDKESILFKLFQTYELEIAFDAKSKFIGRALQVQEKVIESNDDSAAAWTFLALLYLFNGKKEEAESASEKALKFVDSSEDSLLKARAHCVRGLIYLEGGKLGNAQKELLEQGTYPVFELANKLIESGELDIVKQYVKNNVEYWDISKVKYSKWITMLNMGLKPKLEH